MSLWDYRARYATQSTSVKGLEPCRMHIDAYTGIFPLSLVSAGQVVLLRDTYLWVKRIAELSAKLSNQLKERGSVHGPFG